MAKATKKKRGTKSAKAAQDTAVAKEEEKAEPKAKEEPEEDDDAVADGDEEEAEEESDEEAAGPPGKTKARRLEKALAKDDDEDAEPRGVIYLGHIPKGFAEPQLRKFFSQFGKITRMRLSRSKKNAGSKGYGWVEFEEESVAKIVAETMHKYLMFGKQLVCHLVPKEKQHAALFKGCKRRMINHAPARRRKAREAYNKRPTVEVDGEILPQTTVRQAARRKKSDKKLGELMKRLEVDFDPAGADSGTQGASASAGATAEGKPAAKGKKRKAEPAGSAEEPPAAPPAAAAKAKATPAPGTKGGKRKRRKAE